jgi:hypothetical protein
MALSLMTLRMMPFYKMTIRLGITLRTIKLRKITLSKIILSIKTLSIMSFGIMTFEIKAFDIMTFGILTLSTRHDVLNYGKEHNYFSSFFVVL